MARAGFIHLTRHKLGCICMGAPPMSKCLFLPLLVLATTLAPARDKTENWIDVRSPHFTVITNSNEKQGRRVADQFERMRSVFHVAFPKLQIDPGAPIMVLAIKDEKDFRALEPQTYLARGSLKLGGLFLRAPDKNYVLMRLDAEGEHPYAVVYHEYTHLLTSKAAEWMPLWLNEGLAEFYQNSEIREKEVSLGEPSGENLLWLRQNRLLPLTTLFTVDEKSPYYHEENKGSIFYAESWALVHYIQIKDHQDKTDRIGQYAELLIQRVDPVTAATRAFGDLKQLQSALESYIQQASFKYFKMTTTTEVDDSAFKVEGLTPVQADAVRADFLAYNQRTADAQALLNHVLQQDPKNVAAQETLGFLEFRQGHFEEARQRYAEAVHLDSQNFLAHYYFAAISMTTSLDAAGDAEVEGSLRTAIRLNPSFAPAYDRLATLLGMRRRDLDEARLMGVTAVSLEPANIGYRITVANVLLAMGQAKNAVNVLGYAANLAKTQEEIQVVDNLRMNAQEYAAAQEQVAEHNRRTSEETETQSSSANIRIPHLSRRKEFVPDGPHRFVIGILKAVQCDASNLDLTVSYGANTLALHADNFYKIQFTVLNFQPNGDLKPCTDLENRPAKVEYVESADKTDAPHVIAIELHK
jgi:tetratricopeptide (TPR) repeat protein